MRVKITKPLVCFCLPKETYHMLLSSITIVLYVKEIFENWTRVLNKNQTKQTTIKETAGHSTIGVVWIPVVR
jgi:hypothetical protein